MAAATAALRAPHTLVTADAGYHSEANLKALAAQQTPALIADAPQEVPLGGNGMRKRDERFKEQGRYQQLPDPLYDKAHPAKKPAASRLASGSAAESRAYDRL